MFASRLSRLRHDIKEKHATGMLITNPQNVFYLSGFVGVSPNEREATMYVSQESAYLFLPPLYEEEGKETRAVCDGSVRLEVDHDRYGLIKSFAQLVKEGDIVLFEAENLTIAEHRSIQEKAPCTLVPTSRIIETLRLKKDEHELTSIKKAVQITDTVFASIIKRITQADAFENLTELDIADAMRSIGRAQGAQGFGFDPIVAVGDGSALPHYKTSTKPLEKNKPLLMDFGFRVNGYTSDMTRTIHLGSASDDFKKIYTYVYDAQMKSLDACKAGMTSKELFHVAFDHFSSVDVEKKYLGYGHGFGLDVHERPVISPYKEMTLEPGMVITIEPGLYFPGKFGVRIEDDVLITENGCDILTESPRELVEIEVK